MKDIFLISIMFEVFVFGYFVMAKIERFIEENHHLSHVENRQNRTHIRNTEEYCSMKSRHVEQLE